MNTSLQQKARSAARNLSVGPSGSVIRHGYAAGRTVIDSVRERRLVVTRWVPAERRWHYRWPEGRVADTGRWKDAQGWATRGFYYGMDDLLFKRYRPRAGDVVFDVGAGNGGETLYLASMVGPSGNVYSVEAAPAPFNELDDLVRRNHWNHVKQLNLALTATSGEVTISDDVEQWVGGNIFESTGSVPVVARSFDDLCAELGVEHVDWVKMNIEGAEKEALLGMERMAPRIENFTISCHDFLGTEWGRSKDVVMEWLVDHGFTAELRGEGDFVQQLYVYAWRDTPS